SGRSPSVAFFFEAVSPYFRSVYSPRRRHSEAALFDANITLFWGFTRPRYFRSSGFRMHLSDRLSSFLRHIKFECLAILKATFYLSSKCKLDFTLAGDRAVVWVRQYCSGFNPSLPLSDLAYVYPPTPAVTPSEENCERKTFAELRVVNNVFKNQLKLVEILYSI
ncbi:hypothetical protein AVEN_156370-1, partial [Araneus ventricosus]